MKRHILTISLIFAFVLTLSAQIRPVIISEVFYDSPLEENMLGSPDNHHNGEFIELYNPTTENIDISGWRIRDNNPVNYFTFPQNTSIRSKEVILVAFKHPKTDFKLNTLFPNIPTNTKIFYQDQIWLNNSGDEVVLYDNRGNLVDGMSYKFSYSNSSKVAYYWNIQAYNGKKTSNLVSLQRKCIHQNTIEIRSLQSDYFTGKTTPGIVYPDLLTQTVESVLYPSGTVSTNFSVGTVNTNLPVGALPGVSSVSPTGAAMYQIPIDIPAGTNGFQPQISIVYNSQGGYGALGMGWDIAGVSAVSRGMQNFYFDQTNDGKIDATTIKFDDTDRLFIDGQRLILLSGTHFQAGAIYGSETENYARVEIKTSPETQYIYFELTTKEGAVTEYGKTENSLLKDGSKIMAWKINKTRDVYGNEINYTYQDNGQYLKSISYGNSAVSFLYANNTDSPQKRCINGFWNKQEKLLNEVQILYGKTKTLEKGYQFAYDNYSSATYARLDAVKPYFGSNKTFINPTKIGWGAESKIKEVTLDKMQDGQLNNIGRTHLYTGDIDGDGHQDIIEMWEGDEKENKFGYIAVTLQSNKQRLTVGFPSVNEIYEYFSVKLLVGDIDNDGKDEIFLFLPNQDGYSWSGINIIKINAAGTKIERIKHFNYYEYYSAPLLGLHLTTPWNNAKGYNFLPMLLNMNGDEYLDLVIIPYCTDNEPVKKKHIVEVYYGGPNGITGLSHRYEKNEFFSGQSNPVIGDFNADGIPEVMIYSSWFNYKKATVTTFLTEPVYIENYLYIDALFDFFLNYPAIFEELYTVDIDNDGITGVLARQGDKGKKKWLKVDGTRTVVPLDLHNFFQGKGKELEGDYAMFIDYNGDGYTDVIIADDWRNKTFGDTDYSDYEKTMWYFYKNTGGKFELEYTMGGNKYFKKEGDKKQEKTNEYAGLSRMNPVVMDINGDGVPDLVFGDRQGNRYNRFYKAFTMPNANKRNVVHSITNGMGQIEKFEYKYFSAYNHTEKRTNLRDLKAPLMVVDKHTELDGSVTTYSYEKPKIHTKGKGYLGFEKVTVTNSRTKQKTVSEYEINTDYYTVNPKKQTVSINDIIDIPISESVQTNDVKTASVMQGKNKEKRFIPIIIRQVSTDKLTNAVTTTTNTFNEQGILTKTETVTGDVTSITEYLDYVKRNDTGLVAYLPKTIKTTNKRIGQPDYVFTSAYTYNDKGDIETSTKMKGSYAENKTTYLYWDAGNLKETSLTTADNPTQKVTKYFYDDDFRFVTETENVLGQKSYTKRDKWGRITDETGIDGFTTTYKYDALGRLIEKTLPTGEKISYKTEWGTTYRYREIVTSSEFGKISETHYSALGLETYSETQGWEGKLLKSFTEYDPATLKVSRQVKPRYDGEVEVYTDYEYKGPLMRMSAKKTFDGNNLLTTKYACNYFDGRFIVTVTAPDGTQSSSTTNALGEVISRTDAGGTITYTYNALSKPVKIETNNSVTTIIYDAAGRQKELIDPNTGKITYEYYADGQLKKQTNANGDITEFTYDHAGRQDTKTVKDYENGILLTASETKYNYIASGNGIGQIQNITLKENNLTVHSQTFGYNNKHLLESATDYYDGKNYRFEYTYDRLWRPENTTSPSGLVTTNEYNKKYGYLEKIKKGATVIWEGTAQNSNGQFKQYKVNNGTVITTNTYNPRGELTNVQTKKGDVFIQNNQYSYDAATGNLTARNDLKNGRNETFKYDNLDRLTHAYLNGVLQHEMSYLPNGNIDTKSDVGVYRYDANNKPNAMRGINGTVGEGISNEKQYISYNAFNKISRVAQGKDEFSITNRYNIFYGLDQQRIKSQYYDNGKLKLTRYYFGSYEKDIDDLGKITETDYICTPAGLTAIVRNANEFFYIHSDRQGSLERITNASGNIVSEYTYTAWGSRILLSGTNITDRGYTGHEHLIALGLINMNGRVYDPVLARFLSPDPYVQAPDFTQSFNRYSYCLNNPFKYTDPSGEYFFYINLGLGWSKDGGFSISLGVGIGFKDKASVGISIGYDFGSGDFNAGVNFCYAGSYTSAGWSSSAGWNVSTGYSYGAQVGIFSVSVFSAGGSYSENGGFSANVWYYNYNQYNGFSVNPSVSVGYTATTGNYGTYDVKDPGGLDRDDPIPYDRTAAYKFMCDNDLTNSNHQWENLYADGTVLHGYTYDNGEAKNKEGKPVLGVTQGRGKQYLFWGKEKSDIYFYKAAFRNPEMLFYVIQHELVHVNLNYAGVRNSNAHEAAAYRLTADQLKAWGLSSSFYQGQANSYFAKYPYLHPHQQVVRINRPINSFR